MFIISLHEPSSLRTTGVLHLFLLSFHAKSYSELFSACPEVKEHGVSLRKPFHLPVKIPKLDFYSWLHPRGLRYNNVVVVILFKEAAL